MKNRVYFCVTTETGEKPKINISSLKAPKEIINSDGSVAVNFYSIFKQNEKVKPNSEVYFIELSDEDFNDKMIDEITKKMIEEFEKSCTFAFGEILNKTGEMMK